MISAGRVRGVEYKGDAELERCEVMAVKSETTFIACAYLVHFIAALRSTAMVL